MTERVLVKSKSNNMLLIVQGLKRYKGDWDLQRQEENEGYWSV